MSDTPLYTLRQIARELNLPESTVRYYRDAFAAHIATVGMGRRRRYPEEAVATLRAIAEGYAQGRTHEEVEANLFGGPAPARARPQAQPEPGDKPADDTVATLLKSEREQRDAMWQMARELMRVGEAVERTQVMLGELSEKLAEQANRTLPPAQEPAPAPAPPAAPPPPPAFDTTALERELESLRTELTHERELVERLRKSKLDIERRAAEAESQLENGEGSKRRNSVFGRFRPKEPGDGGDA
jgi:DNA-binding transcriptional MerR regulator